MATVTQRGATRVVFGSGAVRSLATELDALSVQRVLVIATPGRKADVARLDLGKRRSAIAAIAKEHVPVDVVAEGNRELAAIEADAIVAYGGGSAIGLAKALALGGTVKVIAIPTTYSGSEMTPVYGITDAGEKKTGRDDRVRPSVVIYDPDLVQALPRATAVTSVWNAMAHAAEALWLSTDSATRVLAEHALGQLASSVTHIDTEYERALDGARTAGSVFADVGSGVHHKTCHVLGGMFALPHAATHAVVLPYVVSIQQSREARAAIARALGVNDPVRGLLNLARASGAPLSLAELGMPREGIERAAEAIAKHGTVDKTVLVGMLTRAWTGSKRTAATPLRAPSDVPTQPGLGSTHESEALPGALPRRQNMPHPAPYGLLCECMNGTPFTVKSAENSRVWMYRARASFSHESYEPLPSARFAAPLGDVNPNRTRWNPLPIPTDGIDFVDGLITLGGAGDPISGPGYAVHMYSASADMIDRSFSNADGDLLIVPQTGTLECRTELGWLRAPVGTVILIPRAMKFAIGLPEGKGRGWILEVYGRRLRLPERGPIGSNGLADARHFLAPVASYEDRSPEGGFEIVHKAGGNVFTATQEHSPFDVVAWHGNHVPFTYDLSLFNAMGSVTFDHPDPSILTVLTAPLDDHGRAIADFVVFPGRWEVHEHSFRPPYMHRNAATEINMVIRAVAPSHYEEGATFVSPLLTAHGISTAGYDEALTDKDPAPVRIPDESLWVMFESAMPFRFTKWAQNGPQLDTKFNDLFKGMKSRFDPKKQ